MNERIFKIAAFCFSLSLLGGCLLTEDFAESPNTTTDSRTLLLEQLPGVWAGLSTNDQAPNSGWVATVDFREGGLTLDVGLAQYQGSWEVTDDNVVMLNFGSTSNQDSLSARPTVINGEVVDLSIDLELAGRDRLVRLRRVDRSTVPRAQLKGDWRTSLLDDNENRLGTEFGETSHYGIYRLAGQDRYLTGTLRVFPCTSSRDCWMLADATFSEGVTGDDGADLSGKPAPLLGGAIIVEQDRPTAIYLPILDNRGLAGQLLAEQRPL